jgi:hypothetical protein
MEFAIGWGYSFIYEYERFADKNRRQNTKYKAKPKHQILRGFSADRNKPKHQK